MTSQSKFIKEFIEQKTNEVLLTHNTEKTENKNK